MAYKDILRRAIDLVGVNALAEEIDCTPSAIYMRLSRPEGAPLSAEWALAIERATNGEIKRSEVRPDIWPDTEEASAA